MRWHKGLLVLFAVSVLWCLPAVGCGGGESLGDPPSGSSSGVTPASLQAEMTVPHLWATVEALWLHRGEIRIALHIDRAGGLGPAEVWGASARWPFNELALRTTEGQPVMIGIKPHDPGVPVNDYLSVPAQGPDLTGGSWPGEARVTYVKPLAARQSRLPSGTWLRYYLCGHASCHTGGENVELPMLGVGMVQFGRRPDGGNDKAALQRWKTSDLRSEVTVPHLWATVRSAAPSDGRTAFALHLEPGGGLEPLRVSRSDLERAAADILLRSKEGNSVPAWADHPFGPLAVPRADRQDYVAVPAEGLDIAVMEPIAELYYCQALAAASPVPPVPEGSLLRYYLCSEVSCRTPDMKKAFFVPLMGVGLVTYGGESANEESRNTATPNDAFTAENAESAENEEKDLQQGHARAAGRTGQAQ